MGTTLSRRELLVGAGAVTLTLGPLRGLAVRAEAQAVAVPTRVLPIPAYTTFQDVYRQRWTWDRVVKGAHHVVNCVSSCPFNLYVKDGIVWREEQNAVMEANRPGLPDFNPRGCQKGACFSSLMYGPQRLKYPLKRLGARGEGKWKRITWDEALDTIADRVIETATTDGPECVIYDSGTANADYGAPTAGEITLFDLLGATQLDGWATVGDMPLGVILTWGLFNMDSTSDDYFNADLVFLWLGNPSYTRIPDAHFLWEARYHGTKIVSVAPDYNASTMHVDQWVNLRVGTDAALALGMAHVIVGERLYKREFVAEQTDLPLLVREDTRQFLRQADVRAGGADNVFYLWDTATQRLVEAPGSEGLGRTSTLALGALAPALEGRFEVALADGTTVQVRPVFEALRARLADYTPERAAQITGVSAHVIRSLAQEFAAAKAVTIFGSWGMMKHHHSDLFQRAMLLLLALTGNVGRRGTGIRIGCWYMMSSLESILSEHGPTWYQKILMQLFKPTVRELIGAFRGYEAEHMYMMVPGLMFLYEHGGLKELVDNPSYHDANPGKAMVDAMRECIANNWVPLWPRPGKTPKVYVHTRVNPLRRWPAPQVAEKNLWPKLDLIVGINIKMSTTCLKSDLVLPAAGYYERRGIKYAQSYVPYYAVGDKAVDPIGESKTEWEISGLLARKIQEKARARKLPPVPDVKRKPRDFATVYDRWTKNGRFTPEDDLAFYDAATGESPEIGNIPWAEAAAKGAIRIKDVGPFRTHTNLCSDYDPNDTVYPGQWFVEHKQPWPTLTGRQQFYIDHAWYLAAHEELPIHKEPPKAGGDYPLRLTGGHTRWSIHSIWREENLMMRLQRGEPVAYISAADAAARGIRDNDRIRVFNDVGSCEILAKPSPSVQQGQVIIYHGWEPTQFKEKRGNQEPVPSTWKSLHMTEYGQLHYRFLYAGPHHTPRGTTVDIQRV
ncbi:MAG: molybdopterin-dependent oxidoreductase [Candidatus Binatia bacterium]